MPFRSAKERAQQFISASLLAERADVRSPRFIDLVDARASFMRFNQMRRDRLGRCPGLLT